MTFAAAKMIQAKERGLLPLLLIVALMIADGFWNCVLFRLRRVDWAFWYLFPYAVLTFVTTVAVFAVDRPAGALLVFYLAFLPYDFAWTKALGRLNSKLPPRR